MGYNSWVVATIFALIVMPLCALAMLFYVVPIVIHLALVPYQVDWRKGVEITATANDVEPYHDTFDANETKLSVAIPIPRKLIFEAERRYPKTTNGYVIFTRQDSGPWRMRDLQPHTIIQSKSKIAVAADWNYRYTVGSIPVSNNTATRRRLAILSA